MEDKEKEKNIKYIDSQREIGQKSEKTLIQASKSEIMNKTESIEYKESPERWYNLVAYCFCLFANGLQLFSFSPISNHFLIHYSIPIWKINLLTMIYFIIYPFVFVPEAWFLEKYNLKIGLFLPSICTLVGSIFKVFTNYDKTFSICFIGQIISGLFRPLLLSAPGKLASNWFKEDKRTIICSIISLSDTAGILVGYLWNLGFIKEDANEDEFKDQLFRYFLSKCILILLFCIPGLFVDKNKPDFFSSPSQSKKILLFIDNLKMLCKNKKYIFLLISSFFIVGYYFILGNIINNYLDMYKITKNQCFIIYSVSIVAGIISSIIISIILDKIKKFKLFLIILSFSGLIFQILFTVLLELSKSKDLNGFAISVIFYILLNVAIIPFYTIVFNYTCEISFPTIESYSVGLLMLMPQLCGIVGFYLFDHLIKNNSNKPWIINVILIAILAVSLLMFFFLDNELPRYNIDKNEKINEGSDKHSDKDLAREVKIEINQSGNS